MAIRCFGILLGLFVLHCGFTQEESAGAASDFERLFNDKDFTGWHNIGGNSPKGYGIANGVLSAKKGAETIYSEREFENFVLRFEFKLPGRGNSGIAIRAPKGGDRTVGKRWNDPAYTAAEIQILDDHHPQNRRLNRNARHGSLYQLVPISTNPPLKKPGQWNQQEIRVEDARVIVTLNGTVVLDGSLVESKTHQNAKGWCSGTPGVGAARGKGSIAIMNPTPGIAFRKMEVKALPGTSRKTETVNESPAGFMTLFNGTDKTGWQGLLGAPYDNPRERAKEEPEFLKDMQASADRKIGNWQVNDGVLTCVQRGRGLATVAEYADFEFQMEYRLAPDCDAGLLLRGTPQLQIWDAGSSELARYGADKGSGAFWFHGEEEYRFPLAKADKPAGEWNHLFVRMVRDRVSVWLNDELVLNGVRLMDYWNTRTHVVRRGSIGILASAKKAEYRNIYVRELKAP